MISIAMIGAGLMARTHARALTKIPNAEIHCVCTATTETGRSLANDLGAHAVSDYDAILNDDTIDAIDLCIPTALHRSFAVKALAAHKHILIEKPVALNLDDAQAIIDAAAATDRVAMVAMVLRFWPAYRELLRAINSGAIGEPQVLSASRLAPPPAWKSWMNDHSRSGGHIIDLMIHDLDFTTELLGQPHKIHTSAAHSLDHAIVTTEHDAGIATHEGSWSMPATQPLQSRLRVIGTDGTLEHHFTPGSESLTLHARQGEVEQLPFSDTNPYQAQIAYFIDCLENETEPTRASVTIGRDALALALAARRSAEGTRTTP